MIINGSFLMNRNKERSKPLYYTNFTSENQLNTFLKASGCFRSACKIISLCVIQIYGKPGPPAGIFIFFFMFFGKILTPGAVNWWNVPTHVFLKNPFFRTFLDVPSVNWTLFNLPIHTYNAFQIPSNCQIYRDNCDRLISKRFRLYQWVVTTTLH